MVLHRELFYISKSGIMLSFMAFHVFINCVGTINRRINFLHIINQLLQGFQEFTTRVNRSVCPVREVVLDEHIVIFVRINIGQMNCNRISRTTALAIIVADYQEISKTIYPFILIGNMQIGEMLHFRMLAVGAFNKAVTDKDTRFFAEVLAVELATILFDKNMFGYFFQDVQSIR